MNGYTEAFAINESIDEQLIKFDDSIGQNPRLITLAQLNYIRTIQTHLFSWAQLIKAEIKD